MPYKIAVIIFIIFPIVAETNFTAEAFRGIYRSIGSESYIGKVSAEQVFDLTKFKYNMKYVKNDVGIIYSQGGEYTHIVKDNYYYKAAYRFKSLDTLYNEHTGAIDLGYKVRNEFPFIFDFSFGYNGAYNIISDGDKKLYHLAALKLNCFISENTSIKWHMRSNFNDRPYEYWIQAEYSVKVKKWFRVGLKYQWDFDKPRKLDEELTLFITLKSGGI